MSPHFLLFTYTHVAKITPETPILCRGSSASSNFMKLNKDLKKHAIFVIKNVRPTAPLLQPCPF